jgi:phosphatidylinositol alpha-1,6-mannosyltransferase
MLASERYKGHDELIDAWPRVVAAVPKARLVIAGDGDDVPRLQEKARRIGKPDSILFTGFASGSLLSGLYDRAAVFALPSRAEGFGLVYLEAMAHRLPCIGSIHDAAGDVIVDGCTGRLVDQLKSHALADAIVDLLDDDQTRCRMGEAGHRRLHEEFTFAKFAERVDALLDRRPQVVAGVEIGSGTAVR